MLNSQKPRGCDYHNEQQGWSGSQEGPTYRHSQGL